MNTGPVPLGGAPDDDPTAALLRDVLHREAEAVRPSPDGLARIRAGIAERPRSGLLGRLPRGGPLRPGRHLGPLAAAAAAVVLAAAGTAGVQVLAHRGQGGSATVTTAQQLQRLDQREAAEAPQDTLPVYVAGLQNGSTVLFREFRRQPATGGVEAKVKQAVELAINEEPLDPDYTRLFAASPRTVVRAKVTAERVDVDLSPAPRPNSPDLSLEEARVALQQVVWTATAAADVAVRAEPPGSPYYHQEAHLPPGGRAVRVTLGGGTQHRLFDAVPVDGDLRRASGTAEDPRAKVWIIDPRQESKLVPGRMSADGDAVAGPTGTVLVRLLRDGVVVREEDVPLTRSEASGGRRPPTQGQRGSWSIQGWEVSRPGVYTLLVSVPAGDEDNKDFTVT